MRITFRFHYWRNCTLRKREIRFGLYQGLRQMCSERRSELTVKCVVNGVFLAVLFAKVVFRGILRVVSKLTAEMPMRYACRTHVAYVIGQLRQMTHGGVFSRRHPVHPDACLFLSADFNPDDNNNRNDCNPNAHRLSPPFPPFAGHWVAANDATALCRQQSLCRMGDRRPKTDVFIPSESSPTCLILTFGGRPNVNL